MARSKTPVKKKIDIFVILDALDRNDYSLYDQIAGDPEALKEFKKEIGFMIPLWMTGSANDSHHLELVQRFNENCNRDWFALSKYPRMQAKLLASIGLGHKTSHRFSKVRAATKNSLLEDFLQTEYPDIRACEVVLWTRRNSLEQLTELAQSQGLQQEQIELLQKAYQDLKKRQE